MEKEKVKNYLRKLVQRYNMLYQYVCVENFSTTEGYEYLGEMEVLGKEIKFLQGVLIYL